MLVTVCIMFILVTVTLEMNRKMRSTTLYAGKEKDLCKMRHIAESGIQLAKAVLAEDAEYSETDSIQEKWANKEKLDSIVSSLGFENAKISLDITDETGKLQINSLLQEFPGHEINMKQYRLLEGLFHVAGASQDLEGELDPSEFVNPVIDWMDSGDTETTTGLSGAESAFYRELDPPYECANREFASVEEIFLVKGIGRDLFTGRDNGNASTASSVKLQELITVYGAQEKGEKRYYFPGRININTADKIVIAALLPFGKRDLAQEIVEYRKEKTSEDGEYINDLTRTGWYRSVLGLTRNEFERMEDMITLSSHIFSITCSVEMKKNEFRMKTFVKREKESNGNISVHTLRQETSL